MNKFFLMIFSVSIFFTGLGGIVNQISAKFNSGASVIVTSPQIETGTGEQTKINSLKSFTLLDKSKKRVVIKSEKTEKHGEDFQIKLRLPFPPDEAIELPRQPSSEPLRQGGELPRINEKDIVILLNKDDAKSQNHLP